MTILGLAVLVAVVVVGVRAFRRQRRERRLPGRSVQSAVSITNYAEIDFTLRNESCPCGGRFSLVGEGPVERNGRSLRFSRLQCRECGRERQLYFDLTMVHH